MIVYTSFMSSSSHLILLLLWFILYLFSIIFFLNIDVNVQLVMNNAFVLNLVIATVLIFVICKLMYCIEFAKFCLFLVVLSFFKKTTYCCRARRLSVCPSVRLSVRPSVRLSVCPSVVCENNIFSL